MITENKVIPDNSLVVGSPGKIIREVTEEEKQAVLENTKHYQDNWKKYSKSIFLKEEKMSAAYLIAQLKVTNSENYKEYIEKVPEIVKKYGGEYLARGGEYTVVEGEDNFPRIILIKFPSYEKALEWYHSEDYKPIKDIRLQNSKGLNIIVKGV